MELPEYRLVLENLIHHFGDKGWIGIMELSEFERADYRTVRARYGIPANVKGIDIAVLAHRKCELAMKKAAHGSASSANGKRKK